MIVIRDPYTKNTKKFIAGKTKESRYRKLLEKQRKQIKKIGFNPRENLFKKVLIETIPSCNNDCSFCPVSHLKREYGIMSIDLLQTILSELREMNWNGKIALFDNNEPFCDGELVHKIKLAKEMLPNAYHYITTNGTLLSYEKLIELDSLALNKICINNYNDSLQLIPQLKQLLEKIEKENVHLKTNIFITLRKKSEVLTSRGGKAPNKKVEVNPFPDSICLHPFFQLNINWNGKVFLCCNDAEWEVVLGDLEKNSIKEIWESKQYEKVREILYTEGRKGINLCSKCDYFVNKTI